MIFKATEKTIRQAKIKKISLLVITIAIILTIIGVYYELLLKLKGKILKKTESIK